MILIISLCEDKLHELEYIRPIEDILKSLNKNYKIKHHSKLNKKDLENSKIIICGTSLKDFEYTKNLENFNFLKEYKKPILGICAGMQIISLIFGGKLKDKLEMGFYEEQFNKKFLGLEGKQKVYHLHTKYVSLPKEFESFTKSKIPQAIKHKSREIYGVLFHPEVRNKIVIENFINI